MRISKASSVAAIAALLSGAAAAGWAQKSPESILPPGFGEPAPIPSRTPARSTARPTGAAPVPRSASTPGPSAASGGDVVQPLPAEPSNGTPLDDATPTPEPSATPTPDAAQLAEYELPSFARRSLDTVGVIGPGDGGVPSNAFGATDGRRLEIWMRRLDGRIASRWLEITLRRMLVSRLDTPAHVNGADFAAERAWLLLRMGEAVAARDVVQGVDTANYTPKLYQIAMQTALATADPAALCPIAAEGANRDRDRAWALARAICVSLGGSPAAGFAQLTAARRARIAGGIDLNLAQKLVGVGGQGRQAVTLDWDPVGQLTAWRWGLATAAGAEVPAALYDTAGPQLAGWRALAPAIPIARRAAPAEIAAATGVISSAALIDLYSALGDENASDDDAGAPDAATAAVVADLRTAYSDGNGDARAAALRRLWGVEGTAKPISYGRLVLTAHASARAVPRSGDGDADRLIAAMLSAGLDRTALRWRDAVAEGSDGWAMLLLADPDAVTAAPYSTIGRYGGSGAAALKQRFLFAALAGLGRMSGDDVDRGARTLGVAIGRADSWTRAIDRAAQDGEPGTVVLLAAMGMQTPDWRGVTPEALFHIVYALRATGLDGPARMIAAEALARL